MDTKLYEALLKQLEMTNGEQVVFWGASLFLKGFLEKYSTEKYNIKGIIDNNSSKWGEYFCGYKIIPRQELKSLQPVSIIFTIKNYSEATYNKTKKIIYALKYPHINILPNIFKEENFSNNNIYVVKDNVRKKIDYIPGIDISFIGSNNTIEIGEKALLHFFDSKMLLGSNNKIRIGASERLFQSVFIRCKNNTEFILGKDCSICSGYICLDDNLKVQIGDDCMFSAQIYIRAGDGHTIYDVNTKEILNAPERESIIIGNHVWLASSVSVLKNTRIADNTVVARGAIVTKKFDEPNVILAGNPAKIVKSGVNWSRKSIEDFKVECGIV